MVDYIVIASSITIIEALDIANNGNFKEPKWRSTGLKTSELKDYGIREVSLWADTKKIFTVSQDLQNCFFSATIDAAFFVQNRKYNKDILGIVEQCLPEKYKGKMRWKIKSVSFVYNFEGYYTKQYYMLLRSGYDLDNLNMQKTTEKLSGEPQEQYVMKFVGKGRKPKPATELEKNQVVKKRKTKKPYQESMNIEVMLDYHNHFDGPDIQYVNDRRYKDCLQLKVKCKKKKTIQMCRDYGVEDRDFYKFMEKLDAMDRDIFENYAGRIGGTGCYYRYDDAEKIIKASELTPGQKQKMSDALKGVSLYKGISNYLRHVEDEEIKYSCMESIRQRKYAVETLNQLQKIGINPLNLSVRSKVATADGNLQNLIDVYIRDREKIEIDNSLAAITPVPLPVSVAENEQANDKIKTESDFVNSSIEFIGETAPF